MKLLPEQAAASLAVVAARWSPFTRKVTEGKMISDYTEPKNWIAKTEAVRELRGEQVCRGVKRWRK